MRKPNCTVSLMLKYTNMFMLSVGDLHVSAEFQCRLDAKCKIRGSFFFHSQMCPPIFAPGDTVKLDGVDMQEWNGGPQLSGKNVLIVPV